MAREWGKFKFKDKEYDLSELVEANVLSSDDFYVIEENGKELGIIKKTGIERLQDYFGVVVTEVMPIQPLSYNGIDLLVLQIAVNDAESVKLASDGSQADTPTWEMSEVSPENLAAGISNDYPVSMLWKRTVGRAVRRHIGLYDWYTQDEFKELKSDVDRVNRKNKPKPPKAKPKNTGADEEDAKLLAQDPHEDWSVSDYAKNCAFMAREMGYTEKKYLTALRNMLEIPEKVSFMPERIARAKWIGIYLKFQKDTEEAEKVLSDENK